MDFNAFFQKMTEHEAPFPWQAKLARREDCGNRLIRVETGMGKTQGVLAAWLYHRVISQNSQWPRRLVWCLPMRTLVEQTRDEIIACIQRMDLDIDVYTVMGGENEKDWHLFPERDLVLVGTSDMLLSRALNRGYAAARARWPMEFGLLHSDCLWVLDEVQLMDAGLSTTAQLQAFREQDQARLFRPSWSWWMSATLRPEWLRSVDTADLIDAMQEHSMFQVDGADQQGVLWTCVSKPLEIVPPMEEKDLAAFAAAHYAKGKTTLVILNTVKRAVGVFEALSKRKDIEAELRLVHSRFRPWERQHWRQDFLRRDATVGPHGRIVVTTQVVEAGVDISADCLMTELAPWPSLVQRFGRAARYGGEANVFVMDITDEKKAPPYPFEELEAARAVLAGMRDVSLRALAEKHASLSDEEQKVLFPYAPEFLLLRKELDDLFDTTPDLTGADLDISRFIRTGEERDCQLFWRELEKGAHPPDTLRPSREELCAVPVGDVRKWFENAPRDQGTLFWKWDYLEGTWVPAKSSDVAPGHIFLCAARAGGYSEKIGFSPKAKTAPVVVLPDAAPAATNADARENDETLAQTDTWRTIAEHGADVASELEKMTADADMPAVKRYILELAARWHDLGKAHPAFVSLLHAENLPANDFIAKAPKTAWKPGPARYEIRTSEGVDARPGFRHELASALALLDALRQVDPLHEGLLGPWQEWLEQINGISFQDATGTNPEHAITKTLRKLSASELNLLLYLIAAHHGKVRVGFSATPADQNHPVTREGEDMPIRGVLEGDTLPPVKLTLPDGTVDTLPETVLHLDPAALGISPVTGASWSERCSGLLNQYGPFMLSWMEALLRAADIRVSRRVS